MANNPKFRSVRQIILNTGPSITSSESSEANVSLVALRRNEKEYGHLSAYEQFCKIGSAAILLQPAKERQILSELIRAIEWNFPHGIRSTTLINCLTDGTDHILPNSLKERIIEADRRRESRSCESSFSNYFGTLIRFLSECTE